MLHSPPDPTRHRSNNQRRVDDPAQRRAVEDFLHGKGAPLRPTYAVLAIVYWLEREHAQSTVCSADVRVLYPRRVGLVTAPLRDPASQLRRSSEDGLLEAHGNGWYTITPLGRHVVEALPDGALVGALLGRRSASCTPRLDCDRRRTY